MVELGLGCLVEKRRSFTCIDHSAPKGEMKVQADIAPILSALQSLEAAIRELGEKRQDINIKLPELPIQVRVPENPVHVTLPELSPTVEVYPSDVVVQRQDGVISDIKPVVNVVIPTKGIMLILAMIPLIMLIDFLLVRFHMF